MNVYNFIEQNCRFKTERLQVSSWKESVHYKESEHLFEEKVMQILTPEVTGSLPGGWQGINTRAEARKWIAERAEEAVFLTVKLLSSAETAGFVFLYVEESEKKKFNLRFGYLLSEKVWARGLGTELVKGLLECCEKAGVISSISGGVERDNRASIRVLEKAGFLPSQTEPPDERVLFYEYRFKNPGSPD